MDIYKNTTLSTKERVEDLLSRMTTLEKVGQINQHHLGFACYEREGNNISLKQEFKDDIVQFGGLGVLYGLYRADPWSNKTMETGIPAKMSPKAYNIVQKFVTETSRFGIPTLMSTECPHGHQALDGYLLPVNLASGATMNAELLEDAYALCGEQLKEVGVDLALISMLDVLRDPRWGRSEECYSEDPYLASKLAEAAVRGCIKSGIDVVAKHFYAQGETTGGVNASAARIGNRELRDIHMPPSQAAINAGAIGIMAAYNEIDGIPCHGNSELLNGVLRDEWNFKGIVMADGCAIDRLAVLTGNQESAGVMALKSGIDVSLWDEGFTLLAYAAEKDDELLKYIDAAAKKILTIKFDRGLMDNPYLDENKEITDYNDGTYKINLEMARQSVVMLKNKLLPIEKMGLTIAVIGPNANDVYNMLGDYTPPVNENKCVTVVNGIINNSNNTVLYSSGCGIFSCKNDEATIDAAVEAAKLADIIILALGGSSSRFSGENEFDTNGAAIVSSKTKLQMDCGEGVDTASLLLPGNQKILAEKIFELQKKTISVIIAGRPYVIKEIADKSDTILYSYYAGPHTGTAIGEIIFGITSPSGRLPSSLPFSDGQVPCYYNFKNSYEAMKYHDTNGQALYSFGQGMRFGKLKYTSFEISHNTITVKKLLEGESIVLNVTCVNTGNIDEYAVPMLFISANGGTVVRRITELKGVQKRLIKVGSTASFTFSLSADHLSVINCQNIFTPEKSQINITIRDGFEFVHAEVLDIM